jgi:lysozyme
MTGWDQLLSAEQRAQANAHRNCQAAGVAKQETVQSMQSTPFLLSSQIPPTVTEAERHQSSGKSALAPSSKHQLASPRTRPDSMPVTLAPLIDRTAQSYDIDPLLLHAIARVESHHRPDAVSPAGAHGLMQVLAPTARRFGVNDEHELHDPLTNLQVSARYLKGMQLRFGNDLPLVLAAYNAGERAVERYGRRVPPYRETQEYVRKVLAEYSLLLRVSAATLSRSRSGVTS